MAPLPRSTLIFTLLPEKLTSENEGLSDFALFVGWVWLPVLNKLGVQIAWMASSPAAAYALKPVINAALPGESVQVEIAFNERPEPIPILG